MGLMKISDLKPAPYNPRKIDTEALVGLGRSLAEFGDISGLVEPRYVDVAVRRWEQFTGRKAELLK